MALGGGGETRVAWGGAASKSELKGVCSGLGLGIAIGRASGELGVGVPLVLEAASFPGIDTELSGLRAGSMRIGGGGVIAGVGLLGVVRSAVLCGSPEIDAVVWGAFACGASLRAGDVGSVVPRVGLGRSGVVRGAVP